MNIDDLKKERENLAKEREQMIANVNAINGALQFCESLIKREEDENSKVLNPADSPVIEPTLENNWPPKIK